MGWPLDAQCRGNGRGFGLVEGSVLRGREVWRAARHPHWPKVGGAAPRFGKAPDERFGLKTRPGYPRTLACGSLIQQRRPLQRSDALGSDARITTRGAAP